MDNDHMDSIDKRLSRAVLSLRGLSVGDAFGEKFFVHPNVVKNMVAARAIPAAPWKYTDDTMMALSILEVLKQCECIDQDYLANSFAKHYDESRGYGPAMKRLFKSISQGTHWQEAASALFDGKGSFGNGSAMRVAPLGAYFADDIDQIAKQAMLSSTTTHCHSEAIAGAIAVATAAAFSWRLGQERKNFSISEFIKLVIPPVPDSEVKQILQQSLDIEPEASAQELASLIGNGSKVSAQDTVPFAIWSAAKNIHSFEEAMWFTVAGEGDRDTTCAIVGGIVSLYAGESSIPAEWLASTEALPEWS